jgi:hypothetical protein
MALSAQVLPRTTACTNSPWQRRQLSCRIWLFRALMRMGYSKTSLAPGASGRGGWKVKPIEWW